MLLCRLGFFLILINFPLCSSSLQEKEQQLATLINQQRLLNGLDILPNNDQHAKESASHYVAELAISSSLSHIDEHGQNSLQRYRRYGGTAMMVGEILANSLTLEAMIDGYLHSPSHREAMLGSGWTTMATALAKQGERYIACVVFSNSLASFSYRHSKRGLIMKIEPYNKERLTITNSFSYPVLALNGKSVEVFYRQGYLMARLPAQLGDYVTFSNAQQQGDMMMIRGNR